MKNKLRIIAGEWRSRQIIFEDLPGLRPTPARLRETLFNWLRNDVIGRQCLDLYAGSGALGFEAASRGAHSVVMVEEKALACRLIKENCIKLSADNINIKQSDVFSYLAGDAEQFDLVFLDPPFTKNMAPQTCLWLEKKGWLSEAAKIYIEVEKQLILQDIPANWHLLKTQTAGDVCCYLFLRN